MWEAGWAVRLDKTLWLATHQLIRAVEWRRRSGLRRTLRERLSQIDVTVARYNDVARNLKLEPLTRPLTKPQVDQDPLLKLMADRAAEWNS